MTIKKSRLSELYKPKSGDEQKFVAKHVVAKHDDVNGNKDDVFQATNVKTVEREKNRHGYAPGKDEEVYEETTLDEKLAANATAGDYVSDFKKSDAPQFKGKSAAKRRQMAIAAYLSKKGMKEEAELNESLSDWEEKHKKMGYAITRDKKTGNYHAWQGTKHISTYQTADKIAKMKKEDVEVEGQQLDELKKSTLLRYSTKANKSSINLGVKASRARDEDDMETWAKHRNKADMRDKGIMRAGRKLREDIDSDDQQLDEVSKATLSSYAKKASTDMHGTWKKATDPTDKDHKKASKRILGMHRAFSKIAKKDMKEDTDFKLFELYVSLSDENKAHMLEMYNKDRDTLLAFVNGQLGEEEQNG